MNPVRIQDVGGRSVALGGEIARGGEGIVFDLAAEPGSVAKIYLAPPDRAKAEKIAVMVGMATPRLTALSAWPTSTLHLPGGQLVGFTMPKLAGHRPVFQVYGPKLRLRQFPKADWRFLVHTAGNVARAFGVVHGSGLVVGDVNQNSMFVGTDATVRFIDTDSMQVTYGGRTWNCEVGVGTHQPPEMQSVSSFKEIVRTVNHDAFGLAVIIFQLLCMGRHPFAGRFAGSGEPPAIPEAIQASRYAYSADQRRTLMSPPPGSLPMSALPPSIVSMFEAAFAPASVRGGRPSADQWTSELATLGKSMRKCTANAGHWHSAASGVCPWCELESRSGVALFPAVFVSGRTGTGIVLLWQEIQSIQEPGPLTPLKRPDASAVDPSPRIKAASRRLKARKLLAAATLVIGYLLVLAVVPAPARGMPFLAVTALAAGFWWFNRSIESAEVRETLVDVRSSWSELEGRWVPGPGRGFGAVRQVLGELKREHDGIPQQREREIRALTQNRRQQQLQAHLEGFEIATARIPGVGRGKVATLLSYGIETAADIDQGRIEAVPGFGPKTASSLALFRKACEASFRFDVDRAVEPARIAALDGMLAQRRTKLESDVGAGLAQLRSMVSGELRHRAALEAAAAELRPIYARALADARAMGVG